MLLPLFFRLQLFGVKSLHTQKRRNMSEQHRYLFIHVCLFTERAVLDICTVMCSLDIHVIRTGRRFWLCMLIMCQGLLLEYYCFYYKILSHNSLERLASVHSGVLFQIC